MKSIRQIVFFLLMPVTLFGQTVHIDEDRIVYKGDIKVDHVSKQELYAMAKEAIHDHVKGNKDLLLTDDKEQGMITTKGSIRLTSPYQLIKTVYYILEISTDNGKYTYRIDSVYFKQTERGGKTVKISSGDLFKGVEATGVESVEAEKILNEIDMNFQKLIALINRDMKKTSLLRKEEIK